MKISKLIEELEALKKQHGDCEVYSGGEDYPGRVDGTYYVKRGDGYTPTGCVKISGGI